MPTPINEKLLAEYAELVRQREELDVLMDEMNARILDDFRAAGVDTFKSQLGTFAITTRSKWTFSPAVEEAEARVKEIKDREKADGVATQEAGSVTVAFRAVKPKV